MGVEHEDGEDTILSYHNERLGPVVEKYQDEQKLENAAEAIIAVITDALMILNDMELDEQDIIDQAYENYERKLAHAPSKS